MNNLLHALDPMFQEFCTPHKSITRVDSWCHLSTIVRHVLPSILHATCRQQGCRVYFVRQLFHVGQQWRIQDFPWGGGGWRGPLGADMDPRHGHFSVKMYVKTKELGPVGGGVCPARPPQIRQWAVIGSFMTG